MMHLYFCTPEKVKSFETEFEIEEQIPGFFKAYPTQKLSLRILAKNIYWWIVTGGKYRIWCALDGKRVIHTSYVVPPCIKFPFLEKGDCEIGPCRTESEYRGRGIYPAVLSKILGEVRTAYMIIADTNASSIKGVTKCGFSVMPGKIKRDNFKRWIYTEENN